ncbi:uncharacterized protein LOC110888181 [Helianthus annuus]|uniref:uncharacterized protein LOC110888181 n=1 Tax=Helianthus annuus TaxID=4232 RepID=UPI000B9096CD|nr:uncharacterized protein LOC110888181 [Helianthus annuus]
MLNSAGFFFFKFDSRDGLTKVLEGGPWLIRKVPLFMNIWSPKVSLKKDGVKTIPLWVKLHNVPISVYTDDGLSLLASKLGTPKRLDSYTADMCVDNWGRSSYARAMIEVNADSELKDYITLAIPKMDEEGYIMERVKVEYEWKPLRCPTCCLFGHDHSSCSKIIKDKAKQVVVDEEGFVTDRKRMAKHGFPQKKQKAKFVYKPKANKDAPGTSGTKPEVLPNNGSPAVNVANSFQALANDDADANPVAGNTSGNSLAEVKGGINNGTAMHDEVIETVPTEMSAYMSSNLNGSKSEGQALSVPWVSMGSVATWNIRGLNRPLKQNEVRVLIAENQLSVCAILETHVNVNNLHKVCKSVFRRWSWSSNGNLCQRGTRIIMGWNTDDVDLMVLYQSDQVVHTQIRFKAESKVFFCSFVYAENKYQDHRKLWEDLCRHSIVAKKCPWVVLGDFNTALNMEDCLYGPSCHTIGMREFFDCIQMAEIMDITHHGCHYTWNQKPKEGIGILKKIDRVMGNLKFLDLFPNAYAIFQPARISDHSPCVIKLPSINHAKPKPFKFANFLTSKPEFKQFVSTEWAKDVQGYAMFSVVKKMRNLKPCFRKLLHQQGNLHDKVSRLRSDLDELQK